MVVIASVPWMSNVAEHSNDTSETTPSNPRLPNIAPNSGSPLLTAWTVPLPSMMRTPTTLSSKEYFTEPPADAVEMKPLTVWWVMPPTSAIII